MFLEYDIEGCDGVLVMLLFYELVVVEMLLLYVFLLFELCWLVFCEVFFVEFDICVSVECWVGLLYISLCSFNCIFCCYIGFSFGVWK